MFCILITPSSSSSLYIWTQGLIWELGSKYIGNWKIRHLHCDQDFSLVLLNSCEVQDAPEEEALGRRAGQLAASMRGDRHVVATSSNDPSLARSAWTWKIQQLWQHFWSRRISSSFGPSGLAMHRMRFLATLQRGNCLRKLTISAISEGSIWFSVNLNFGRLQGQSGPHFQAMKHQAGVLYYHKSIMCVQPARPLEPWIAPRASRWEYCVLNIYSTGSKLEKRAFF